MLSRIAESMFWMNRYLERAEGMLRMLKINYLTSLDWSESENYDWSPILKIFTNLNIEEIEQLNGKTNEILKFIILDKTNSNSIRAILTKARENARGVQDHITKEVWESINQYYQKINSTKLEEQINNGEQLYVISSLIEESLFFYGVAEVTMPRGEGWNFMNIGKFIERSILTSSILDAKFNDIKYDLENPYDISFWKNLLLSISGYEFYMKSYHTGLQTQNVIDMVVMNNNFPRSILYSVKKINHILEKITIEKLDNEVQLEKIIGRLRSRIEYSDIDSIGKIGLLQFLREIIVDVNDFSKKLSKVYFAYN